jgi:PAS domain-containing protein
MQVPEAKYYDRYRAEMDDVIGRLKERYPDGDMAQSPYARQSAQIAAANGALREMEQKAFALSGEGRRQEALAMLSGADYMREAELYARGLDELTDDVYSTSKARLAAVSRQLYFEVYPLIAAIAALGVVWFFTVRNIRLWRQNLVSARNILRLKNVEMHNQKTLLDTLLNNMPLAIFAKDAKDDYKWLMINKMAEEMLCLKQEDVLGHCDSEFFPAEEAAFFRATDEKVMAGGKLIDIDVEPVTTPRGTFKAHTLRCRSWTSAARPRFFWGYWRT